MTKFFTKLNSDLNNKTTNFPRFSKSAKKLANMENKTKNNTVKKMAADHIKLFDVGFQKFLNGRP
jgi:hypothetical protein